jgi:hypothetical protein
VERPRDAPSPSGWPRVPGRPGIRAQKIEPPKLRISGLVSSFPRFHCETDQGKVSTFTD